MTKDVSSHAPLSARLQGQAFLPGVDYVTQAQAWMQEAADEIGRLRALLGEVVADEVWDEVWCAFCAVPNWDEQRHKPDCLWLRIKAALDG